MGGQHAAVKARLAPSVTNRFEAAVGGCLFTWPDSCPVGATKRGAPASRKRWLNMKMNMSVRTLRSRQVCEDLTKQTERDGQPRVP